MRFKPINPDLALSFQPFDPPAGCYDVAKRVGNEEPGRDPLGEGDHLTYHAEQPRRGYRPLGRQGREG